MTIPDHDGRPNERQLELAEAFRRIDADRRLYLVDGDRRVLRAAAAWDNGSEVGVHRELGMAVAEIARRLGMGEWEVRRLLVSSRSYLVGEAKRRFRDG